MMDSRDSEGSVSESESRFYFSDQESFSQRSDENESNHFDIKTEIKSELAIDEYEPSELARWFMDPLEDNATPKDESDVVNISISDVQTDAEASVNKQSLDETQGVKCDSEGLILTEPEKSHQDGRVCHVLTYSSTATIPAGEADTTDLLPELCSSLQEESGEVSLSSSDVQEDGEASVNKLEEMQGVECDAEVPMPKKSHQDGRVYRALSYSETDEAAETLPDSSRGRCSSHGKRKATGKSCEKGSYPCPTCGITFTCLSNLYKHQILHSGQKTHVCQLCGKSFARKDYLNDHMLIHTTGRGRIRASDRELNCPCDLCGKIFRTMHLLQQHQKRHVEDRPFKCEQCTKDFKLRQDFNVHLKTHSGERPHVCNVCGQGFTRAYSLQKHLVVHTGQTPFSCTHCQKKFKSKWGLTCHMKKCNDTQPLLRGPKKPRQHCCPHCQKKFQLQWILKRHMEKCKMA